jgi:type I restriction enzyme, S subunit
VKLVEAQEPWLGSVPEKWSRNRIRNVAALSPSFSGDIPNENELCTVVPMESLSERGSINTSSTLPFGDVMSGLTLFEAGDILFAKITPCMENGKGALVENLPTRYAFGSTEFHVLRPSRKVNGRFLYYYTFNPVFRAYAAENMSGAAGQKRVSSRFFKDTRLFIPALPEQERIASYLDASCLAIDNAAAAKRQQLKTLDTLITAIIQRAVTRGLNSQVELKPSGLDWLLEVPRHWRVRQIKRRCDLLRGKFSHRPRNDPALYDGDYPFVQTGDITAADKYIRSYSQTLNELGFSVSKMFPKGTLVMSIAANIGDVAILDFEACFPDSMIGLVPNHKTDLNFLYYLMRGMKEVLLRSAVLTTQWNLNYVRIGTNFAPFPPKKEQEEIAKFLDTKIEEINRTKTILTQQIDTLIAYRKSLIHECVTGQRRITEADVSRVVDSKKFDSDQTKRRRFPYDSP